MKKPITLKSLQDKLYDIFTAHSEQKDTEPANSDHIVELIEDAKHFPVSERVDVYKEAYFLRLEEALADDFASTKRLLGELKWKPLVREYFAQYPSVYASLTDVGRSFVTYLQSVQPPVEDIVIEMADLEWKIVESFYAPKDEEVDFSSFSLMESYGPEAIHLRLDPAVRLCQAEHIIVDIYQAETKPLTERTYALVYRRDGGVFVKPLSEFQYDLIHRLAHGESLGAVLEDLQGHMDSSDDILAIQKAVQELVQSDVFLKAELKN